MVHHRIVALERIHQPLPDVFDFPAGSTYTLTGYETTPSKDLLHARIRDATIVFVTTVKFDAETLSPNVTPNLVYIAVMSTGTDCIDLEACRKRGIRVTNAPGANLDSVSEHAISLYFAARRRTVMLDGLTRQIPSQWKQERSLMKHLRFSDGKPPLTCKDEVLGIVGYGNLGKRIAALGRALGMKVVIASRKNAPVPASGDVVPTPDSEEARIPFDQVLARATVVVLSLPRTPETLNLFSATEFSAMSPHAVLINISRGGIVDESALVQALRDGDISGYATDVFQTEPAEGPADSPLLDQDAKDLNLTFSPHIAWFSQRTMTNVAQIIKETVEAWAADRAINVIV